jgi:hypothetical protein
MFLHNTGIHQVPLIWVTVWMGINYSEMEIKSESSFWMTIIVMNLYTSVGSLLSVSDIL